MRRRAGGERLSLPPLRGFVAQGLRPSQTTSLSVVAALAGAVTFAPNGFPSQLTPSWVADLA